MSQILYHDKPSLRRPILIVAFSGWSDAGHSASLAAQHLVARWSAVRFAEINPDEFYDFTATRPWVNLAPDGRRRITWPGTTFYAHHDPAGELDAILVIGAEPTVRWRAFVAAVVDLARTYQVSLAVTLGAHLAPVSHRDPVPVSGWAWPHALHDKLAQLDVRSIAYEGPTGFVTVLANALADAEIPVAALWVALPAYLGQTPNPKGALALVTCLGRALGLELASDDLSQASAQFERQVTQAVQRAHALPGLALFQSSAKQPQSAAETTPAEAPASETSSADLPTVEGALAEVEEILRHNRDG